MEVKIKSELESRLGLVINRVKVIGGGSINKAWGLETTKGDFFCKVNNAPKFPQLFQKEATGLQAIAAQKIIAVPEVIDCYESDDDQFLVLQYIGKGSRTDNFWKLSGERLAALHTVSHSTFGFTEDGYMGSVPQSNQPSTSWTYFFEHQRLQPMISRCAEKGLLSPKYISAFDSLIRKLPAVFEEKTPSLVHGDLWSGNFMCNEKGEPVLIDPAVYYGDASVDLGLTTLFGGFAPAFYEAYHYYSPLPTNYKEQWQVSNLYPLLIHLYLFGTGYLGQIERTLDYFE